MDGNDVGRIVALALAVAAAVPLAERDELRAQESPLGGGPYDRLVIRGATLIDGTGGPPVGPVDVVVEEDSIAEIHVVGDDFGEIDPESRPREGTREIDAGGMYLLPGFVNAHGHIHRDSVTGMEGRYTYYLWLAHGITTVLEPGSAEGVEWTIAQADSSAEEAFPAPRIYPYVFVGTGWDGGAITSPARARKWVATVAEKGAAGVKIFTHRPDIMEALIQESHERDIKATAHLSQSEVARMDAREAAQLDLDHMHHWYGLAESMLKDGSVPDWTAGYNQNNEQDTFAEAGRFWEQAADVGSEEWNALVSDLVEEDLTMVPTFSVYEILRDVSRRRNLPFHRRYSSPQLMDYWETNPDNHYSLFFSWTSEDEANWYRNFARWRKFVDDFHESGGRVAAGADAGSGYHPFGFGYIRELELLQHAGLHPLEVIRAASLAGAKALGEGDRLGSVEVGKQADLVLVDANPLEDLKVLYGTGAPRYDPEADTVRRIGGVDFTVKDGVVYDANHLLELVGDNVTEAKNR